MNSIKIIYKHFFKRPTNCYFYMNLVLPFLLYKLKYKNKCLKCSDYISKQTIKQNMFITHTFLFLYTCIPRLNILNHIY